MAPPLLSVLVGAALAGGVILLIGYLRYADHSWPRELMRRLGEED